MLDDACAPRRFFPYGKIMKDGDRLRGIGQLGELVRAHRRSSGATQVELAGLSDVGVRFIGDLERGKPTLEIGKVLRVLDRLGLLVFVRARDVVDRA